MFTPFVTACLHIPSNLKAGVFHQRIGGYSSPVRNIAFSSQNRPRLGKLCDQMVQKLGYVKLDKIFMLVLYDCRVFQQASYNQL
jgi:hypothetical protein